MDSSYAVHEYMKSHKEGKISFGHGNVHFWFRKLKLYKNSSTEYKLLGTIDYVPFNVWVIMFMEAQGYLVNKNFLFQDNQSYIRMEVNDMNLCTVS